MQNSKWIDEYEKSRKNYKLIVLYGNIYDDFFYDNEIINLDDFISNRENIALNYFTEDQMKKNSDRNQTMLGFDSQDGVRSINKIIDDIRDPKNFERNQSIEAVTEDVQAKNCYYIKNPSLFFCDYTNSTNTSQNNLITHSVHLMKEFISKAEEDFLIIIVSEKLESVPPSLYLGNEEVAVIHLDYPSIELREEILRSANIESNETLNTFTKITNGRSLKEIQKILFVADNEKIDLNNPKEVINYYDFGERESPWTKLNEQDVKNIDKILARRVYGQNEAIDYVKKVLIRAKLGLSSVHQTGISNRPIGIFFFVGPTGVGKTELAKALTEAVFGDENQFKRFDMSEYKESSSVNKLIGTSPGYIGFEQGGELTNWVRENPFSVILFDEIEKSNPLIWDTFLQVLEDGRLTDNKGKTVYFSESIIIFTSNIGNTEAQGTSTDTRENTFRKSIKDYFLKLGRVEILNRIGNNIIVFNDIESIEIYTEIINNKLDVVIKNIQEKIGCSLKFKKDKDRDNIVRFIIDKIKSSGEKFGGRAVVSSLETYFINEFGEFYIMDKPETVYISTDNNSIIFNNYD